MNAAYYIIITSNFLIFVSAMLGNSLVITVVRKTRSMRTTTNFLLVNLAVADIVTLLFNPVLHALLWPKKSHSDFVCKFFTGNGFIGLPFMVSVFTLVVIAVERYHALVKPLATGLRLTKENFHYAVIAMWYLSITLNIPIIIDYRYDGDTKAGQRCKGVWRMDMSNWMAKYVMFYSSVALASTLVITYCYVQIFRGLYITNTICPLNTNTEEERRSKKQLAKVLVSVTALFFTTQMPLHIFMMYMAAKRGKGEEIFSLPLHIVASLAFLNLCINPIVYAFKSDNYKTGFKRIVSCQTLSSENSVSYP